MNAELWATIKRWHAIDKVPIADIARRLRLDRKTVRHAIRAERLPVMARTVHRPSIVEPYRHYIAERLQAYPHLPGTVLLRELQKQGYPGRIRALTDYLSTFRKKSKEVFLRLETSPGEQAQCDWANCGSVRIGTASRKLSAFVMVLSYSRMMYVEFTLSQCLEDFMQCHLNAFRFFGGVPRKILYDNLKAVVLSRFGSDIRFNPAFMELAGVLGFEPVPCNVARGNEKGKVENGIYYLRVSFLSGRLLAWPEVNRDVHLWLREVANVRTHRTTRECPVDRGAREKPFLIPLSARGFDAALTRTVRSTHQALVRFDGNTYSVPHASAYKTLILKATSDQVRLLDDIREIATHPRSYDRGAVIENPQHYEGILATKRKHFAGILHKRFLELGEPAQRFLDGLIAAGLHPSRHLQQVLNLLNLYGKDAVLGAIDHAMSCNAYGASYVHNILLQRRAAEGLPDLQPLDTSRADWNELVTEDPDLSVYDQS